MGGEVLNSVRDEFYYGNAGKLWKFVNDEVLPKELNNK